MQDFIPYKKFLNNNPNISKLVPLNLPDDLTISTITLVCKVPIYFNLKAIANNLELSKKFIITVRCGNGNEICRTLVPIKKKKSKKAKKKNFMNQTTIVVLCGNNRKLNIKLFKNGAIQITGCREISYVIWALSNVLRMIKKNNTGFFSAFSDVLNVYNFKIALINSNFNIGFRVNREKLFNLLVENNQECVYDSSGHAGVIISFESQITKHKPTIIVFGKGVIIITGALSYRQVMECYKFINIFLLEHYNDVVDKMIDIKH